MLLFNVHNKNQGFTLIELTILVVIVGILSAIAAPSFLSMLNKNKVNDALDQVRGALQEAQREAIRKSQSCTVTLDTTNNKVTSSCLVTGDRTLPSGVAIAANGNGSPPTITFSFRGNTTDSRTIILYMSDGSTQENKCLILSNGLGIMRTGNYSGDTSSIDKKDCTTLQ